MTTIWATLRGRESVTVSLRLGIKKTPRGVRAAQVMCHVLESLRLVAGDQHLSWTEKCSTV